MVLNDARHIPSGLARRKTLRQGCGSCVSHLSTIGLRSTLKRRFARAFSLCIRPGLPYIRAGAVAGITILIAVILERVIKPGAIWSFDKFGYLYLGSKDVLFFFCLFVLLIVLSFILSRLLAPDLGSLRVFIHTLLIASLLVLLVTGAVLYSLKYRDIYTTFSVTSQSDSSGSNRSGSDGTDAAQNMLTLFSVFLAIGGIGIGIWGFWLQSKMEGLIRVEERVNDLNGLAVIAAESAFAMLPDFSETQQIPDHTMPPLKALKGLIFDEPTQNIVTFLDKKGNGVRLRYARALYHF